MILHNNNESYQHSYNEITNSFHFLQAVAPLAIR